MAADGTISIEVALKGKDQLISDTEQADKILKDFGSQAGDKMDESIKENTDKAKRTLASFPKEVKTELIAEAKDAGIKNFSAILKKLPKEQRVELLTKVEDGKAIDFDKLIKSLPKEVQSEIKVKDEATVPLEKIEKKQQDIPGKKETTVKANDHASAPLRHISNEADDTGRHFRGLRDIIAGTMIGNLLSNGFTMAKSVATGLIGDLNEASASWQTFNANMQNLNMPDTQIAATRKELQEYAQQTIYSASDMATTYSQLAAVGTKNTDILVKGFGGLAAASADPAQAMKSLSQQATQMAAKPKVQWQDFQIMLEQSPAGMAAVSRKMGMSTSELIAKIQDGKVTTGEFFNAIEKAGNAPGFQKMATQYKTIGQAVDGLKETITNRLIGAFQSVSQSGIKTVSLLTDSISNINFDNLAKEITKPIDYINAHFDTVTDIAKNIFKIGQIIGGTVFKTAYDVVIDIAKALGLVDDKSNKVKDPLNKIDGILKNIVSHKVAIENLTKVWLAFFAIKKITGWIKSVNDARKSIMELGIATKIFGDGSGSGISLPSFGGGKSAGGHRAKTVSIPEESETEVKQYASRAERMASEAKPKQSLVSRLMSIFTRNKSAVEESGTLAKDTEEISKGAKVAGRFGGALKAVAGLGTAITVADGIYQLSDAKKKERSTVAGGVVGGGVGGIAGGAVAGAAVGTFAGPVGTAVGAGIGALAGSALGEKIGKSLGGSKIGKKLGMDMQNGVESAFHPKLSNSMTRATDKLHGSVKTFVKSYQGDMDKIMGDTIMLGSATGKQAGKIEADMTKAYAHMSKSVDAYYKGKESKSKKDLDLLVKNGSITRKQADEALAKEKKNDATKAAQMKKSYAEMQKESEKYFKQRNNTESKYEKKSTDAVNKILKSRAAQREKLVKAGATKEELASFDAKTARKVAAEKKKLQGQEDKDLQKLQKGHLKSMKTLQSQADANTYQSLKVSAGKEKDLLQKLSEDKHKMGQAELKEVISTSAKQTNAVVTAANKTYNEAKDAADKKYKATTSAAETEYYVNHSISKSQYEKIVGNAKKQRDDTVSAAKKQRDGTVSHAKEQHKEVVSEATKQAGEHKGAVNTETGDVKSIWDKFVDGVAGVWNHLIDAWNWVGKLWGKKPSGHWNRYAIGTGGTLEDQMAVVGEEGFELAHHPSMGVFPVGVNGMETTFLPAGTSILPHNKSEEFLKLTSVLPHHADGVFGTISDIFDKVKKVTGTIGSSIANAFGSAAKFISKGVAGAWDWIKDHVGFDTVTKNDGKKWSSMRSDYGSNAVKSIEKGFKDTFSSLFKKAKDDQDSGGSGPLKSLPELESIARRAAEIMGVSPSDQFIKQLANVAMSESGGNAGAANLTDSNAKAGMASVGLLQYIPSTWSYYNVPGHNNRSSVLDNFVHFFNNSDWQNSIGYVTYPSWGGMYKWDWKHDGPQGAPRMANGGWADQASIFGEAGEEVAINPQRDSADRLIMEAIAARLKANPNSPLNLLHESPTIYRNYQRSDFTETPEAQRQEKRADKNNNMVDATKVYVQSVVQTDGRTIAKAVYRPLSELMQKGNQAKRGGFAFNG